MILKFGKHAGQDISQVPREYLEWLLDNNRQMVTAIEQELTRRDLSEQANMGWMEKLVMAGYRELAKRHHPDIGGTTSDMQEINAAVERLRTYAKSGATGANGGRR